MTHETERELGNDSFALHQWDAAVIHYTRAIESHPVEASLWTNRSAAYLAKGWHPQALHDADRALALQPTWFKPWSRKGAALLGLGKASEAVTAYKKALELVGDLSGSGGDRRNLENSLREAETMARVVAAKKLGEQEKNASTKTGNLCVIQQSSARPSRFSQSSPCSDSSRQHDQWTDHGRSNVEDGGVGAGNEHHELYSKTNSAFNRVEMLWSAAQAQHARVLGEIGVLNAAMAQLQAAVEESRRSEAGGQGPVQSRSGAEQQIEKSSTAAVSLIEETHGAVPSDLQVTEENVPTSDEVECGSAVCTCSDDDLNDDGSESECSTDAGTAGTSIASSRDPHVGVASLQNHSDSPATRGTPTEGSQFFLFEENVHATMSASPSFSDAPGTLGGSEQRMSDENTRGEGLEYAGQTVASPTGSSGEHTSNTSETSETLREGSDWAAVRECDVDGDYDEWIAVAAGIAEAREKLGFRGAATGFVPPPPPSTSTHRRGERGGGEGEGFSSATKPSPRISTQPDIAAKSNSAPSRRIDLSSLQSMLLAAAQKRRRRDPTGIERVACKHCHGVNSCCQYVNSSVEVEIGISVPLVSSENIASASTCAGRCRTCGCRPEVHETEGEAVAREARGVAVDATWQKKEESRNREDNTTTKPRQRFRRDGDTVPHTGGSTSGGGGGGGGKDKNVFGLNAPQSQRAQRIAAAASRREAARVNAEPLLSTDADVLTHARRTHCTECQDACSGFKIEYRTTDANDPEVMFYCSVCGCRAEAHAVDATWQKEEESRKAAEAAAAARAARARHSSSAAAAAERREEAQAYAALGLHYGADAKAVGRAYKRLALKLHPDKRRHSGDDEDEVHAEFVRVTKAYALLSGKAVRT